MMKKVLKILGVLAAGGLAIGVFWYFQSLKIDGDPLLKTCWAVDIYDDVTGDKIVGAEDLDFDPATGTVFLSAYDRRAVDRELVAGGPVITQGGIYTFNISDISKSGTLNVTDISRGFKQAGNEFRPHGFAYFPGVQKDNGLLTINRRYIQEGQYIKLNPSFEVFTHSLQGWIYSSTLNLEGVCDPFDVTVMDYFVMPYVAVFTDLTDSCEKSGLQIQGAIKGVQGNRLETHLDDLSFPNGIIFRENYFAVSLTTEKSVLIFTPDPAQVKIDNLEQLKNIIPLAIAPDNLTIDEYNNLYVAGFPNQLDYYFYMSELFGVQKSPSAAYRIAPDDYRQELLYKDEGTMISGATVAQRTGDYLILGSGWDDNIAICSGMEELD